MSKLREQFEKENDVNVCDSSGKTFQLYIKWLEDKLTEPVSNVVNPLLGEVLKIIDEEYNNTIEEYRTYALSETYEGGEYDGRITVLNKIKEKILSIST